eukprot:TRINITY_DN181_c0_g1_i4.p1 TRINITY_DN181_c0_g1~~TRINITY_DN181_c0_g1_i4.p1  ORF type:complete len:618 (+),score=199.30 TRINITY_DN181_c0_g1_i4:400-2253(+)
MEDSVVIIFTRVGSILGCFHPCGEHTQHFRVSSFVRLVLALSGFEKSPSWSSLSLSIGHWRGSVESNEFVHIALVRHEERPASPEMDRCVLLAILNSFWELYGKRVASMREEELLASASKAKNYSVRDELESGTHNTYALVPPSESWMMQFVNTFVIPAVTRRMAHSMWILDPSLPSLRWEIGGAFFSVQYSAIVEPSSGEVIVKSELGRKSLGIGKSFKEIWEMIMDGCKVMVGAFTQTKEIPGSTFHEEDLLAKNIIVLCEEANGFVLSFRSFSGMFVLHAFARIVRMHTAACLITFFLEEFEDWEHCVSVDDDSWDAEIVISNPLQMPQEILREVDSRGKHISRHFPRHIRNVEDLVRRYPSEMQESPKRAKKKRLPPPIVETRGAGIASPEKGIMEADVGSEKDLMGEKTPEVPVIAPTSSFRKPPLMKPHPPVGSPPRRGMSFRRPGYVMRSMSLRALPGSQSSTKPRPPGPRLADMASKDGVSGKHEDEGKNEGKEKDQDEGENGGKWATPAMEATSLKGPQQSLPSPHDVFRSQKNLFIWRDPRREKTQKDLARVKERINARKTSHGDVLQSKRIEGSGTLRRHQSSLLGGAVLSSASAGVTAHKEDLED